MKTFLCASLALAALSAATVAAVNTAQAQCPARNCRYFFQPTVRNQWGYGGLVQTWDSAVPQWRLGTAARSSASPRTGPIPTIM